MAKPSAEESHKPATVEEWRRTRAAAERVQHYMLVEESHMLVAVVAPAVFAAAAAVAAEGEAYMPPAVEEQHIWTGEEAARSHKMGMVALSGHSNSLNYHSM